MDVADLSDRLLQLFKAGVDADLSEAAFNELALAVFAYQSRANAPYAGWLRLRGVRTEAVTSWDQIPALPTAAFKEAELTTLPADQVRVVYETSGTTTRDRPGRHLLPGTRLYDASLLPNFQAHLLPDRPTVRMLVWGPTAEHFPRSSLGHMLSRVMQEYGEPGSRTCWTAKGPDFGAILTELARAERDGVPVCVLGVAFGFVHLLDRLAADGRRFRLPPGSRLMDTGGYKGRSREAPKADLYRLYEELLGIAPDHIVNEYGMTELGSQFYDDCLAARARGETPAATAGARRKRPPPWTRVTIADPATLRPLSAGEPGLIRIVDLANLYSVASIQSEDVGVARGDGFEILGRAAGAELRGCSLSFEERQAPEGAA
jgi:hypothetical protein